MEASLTERILVTGGSGLLGSNLLWIANCRGVAAVGTAWRHDLPPWGGPACRVDLTDQAAVRALVKRCQPTAIIHCAALTQVDEAERDPHCAARVNVEATRTLAASARAHRAAFVYLSSDGVFDGRTGGYTENDAPAPINAYARSKLEGERAALDECPQALVLRTCFYGWEWVTRPALAAWLLARLEQGADVPAFTDVTFNPLEAGTLSEWLLDALGRRLQGVYHLGSADACSKFDFAVALARAFGFGTDRIRPVQLAEVGLAAPRPRNTTLEASRIAAALQRPLPTVAEGLERFRTRRPVLDHRVAAAAQRCSCLCPS